MKSKVSIVLVLSFVSSLFFLATPAQAQEQKAQLFAVSEDIVCPSKFMEYEAGVKKWLDFYARHNFPRPVITYRTDDFHYYFLTPIEKLSDMEDMKKYYEEVRMKAGKEIEEIEKLFEGTYVSTTFGIVVLRTDLSYDPGEKRIKAEDINFIWWNYYYIKAGKEKEAEEIAKEWQALWKSHNIADYYNVYQPILWSDLPGLVAAGGAKSAADYYSRMEENLEKMGIEYVALTKKTMDVCREYEQKIGTILRELSYTPPSPEK